MMKRGISFVEPKKEFDLKKRLQRNGKDNIYRNRYAHTSRFIKSAGYMYVFHNTGTYNET